MIRTIRPVAHRMVLAMLCIALMSLTLHAYEVLSPGAGEITISPGLIEGSFLVSAAIRKSVTSCVDIGGAMTVVPSHRSKSELFFSSEFRYGFWYCCIPRYYIDYLYLSVGAGSYSQMGLESRRNAFALSYGPGLRINLFGKFIIGMELKAYSIFDDEKRRDRIAFMLGGGFPL